jgi:hypothetical protein
MAATAAGARLTRQHQQMQLRLRASAINDWAKLWPIWDGSGERFRQLADASVPLVRGYHQMSAAIALDYYKRLRAVEISKPKGAATPALPELTEGQIAGTLYVTGRDMTERALAAGHSPQAAMQNALVRTSGSLTRLILTGGREALVTASIEDGSAFGYRRVTTGTCDFCQELANKGISDNPDFEAHDHCGCVAETAFTEFTRALPIVGEQLKSTKKLLEAEPEGEDLIAASPAFEPVPTKNPKRETRK